MLDNKYISHGILIINEFHIAWLYSLLFMRTMIHQIWKHKILDYRIKFKKKVLLLVIVCYIVTYFIRKDTFKTHTQWTFLPARHNKKRSPGINFAKHQIETLHWKSYHLRDNLTKWFSYTLSVHWCQHWTHSQAVTINSSILWSYNQFFFLLFAISSSFCKILPKKNT